jgi:hypothetical protein
MRSPLFVLQVAYGRDRVPDSGYIWKITSVFLPTYVVLLRDIFQYTNR